MTAVDAIGMGSGTGAAILAVMPTPDQIDAWSKLGGTGILGVICVACLYMHYRSMKDLADELAKLNNNLAGRPCIRDPRND